MMNVFPLVGLSAVVVPVRAPSCTDQKSGLPSQPSRVLPSKIGVKPSSLESSAAGAFEATKANSKGRRKRLRYMRGLQRGAGERTGRRAGGKSDSRLLACSPARLPEANGGGTS